MKIVLGGLCFPWLRAGESFVMCYCI